MSAYGSTVSDVMVKGGTRCRLDTVTYTSPEFDELETLVEVCEPLCETEKPPCRPLWNRARSRSFSSLPNSTKSKRLCKHPVSEQRFRMGGRSLHSRPGIGPTAWLFGLPILWFVSGVPGGISVRDALPRSTARHPE
mgnify:CR=1 FL=1